MSALSSSSRAARQLSAAPTTRWPLAPHASRAAASAKVFPVPAFPTTTEMPAPSVVSRRTISACSSAIVGRRLIARSIAASLATAIPAAWPATACSSTRCSSTSSSGVEYTRSSAAIGTTRPSFRCSTSAARRANGQHDGPVRPQEAVCRTLDLSGRHVDARRQLLAESLDHVAPRERRATVRQPVSRREPNRSPLLHRRIQRPRRPAPNERPNLLGRQAEARRPPPPLRNQLLRADPVVLAPARLQRRDLRGGSGTGATPRELGLDLRPPPAERAQHRRRHTSDVGDPVPHRRPLDTELARQLSPQPRLVEVSGRLRVRIDPPPIERRPAPVRTEREVRDQDVRVELRIAGPRRPMPERGRDQPAARDPVDTAGAAASHRGLPLHVAEGVRNRDAVRRLDRPPHRLIADAEENAHALRRRERQIEPRDSRRRSSGRAAPRSPGARRPARDAARHRRPCREGRATPRRRPSTRRPAQVRSR